MGVPGEATLDRLLRDGVIDAFVHERAVFHAKREGGHGEESLIALGAITEAELLKYKASIYQTRFVSSTKLANAAADAAALGFVPQAAAEKLGVFPIVYDRAHNRLSVVAADFEAHDVVKQVQLVTGLAQVVAYVARPAAIVALQRKHYRRDPSAFAGLVPAVARHGSAGPDCSATDPARDGVHSVPRRGPQPGPHALPPIPVPRASSAVGPVPVPASAPVAAPVPAPASNPVPTGGVARDVRPPAPPVAMPLLVSELPERAVAQDVEELLKVMVTLLEQGRGELRGHSAAVARLVGQLCERMGLDGQTTAALRVAAHAHDLGKGTSYHLTALNTAEYDGHRLQAQQTYQRGLALLSAVTMPELAKETLTHLYERYDGAGFPDRLVGKEIPLGARLLAVAETYCDLTSHGKNPFRRVLPPKDAWDALKPFRGTVFDPDLVDLARSVTLQDGEDEGGDSHRAVIMLVDPDPEETTILELRLVERGYRVALAHSLSEAREQWREAVQAIVAEVDLGTESGFALLEKERSTFGDRPVVFLTRRGDEASVKRGYALGAADYLVKPVPPEVVAAKLGQLLSARSASGAAIGVSGSLHDMALPDVIQILSNGRRSGSLAVKAHGISGTIFFRDGALWDARFGAKEAAEAVYDMLVLQDGEFRFRSEAVPTERRIHDSTETLLLEGMRRFDERTA